MQHSKSRFKIILQDFAERYFQYIYDLCRKKFSSWELRDAYLGGLESTTNLNSSIQLQNVEHATKLFPDITELFRRVFNSYMGKDEECRLVKRKHLFQFFLQEFLAEMSAKLIQKQNDESTVRDINNILSADDRRGTVDFCFQKALASTAKYDSDITEDEITSEDSISIIGSGKQPTAFQQRQTKDLERASLASSQSAGLTKDMLANASASASATASAVPPENPASTVVSLRNPGFLKTPVPSVVSLKNSAPSVVPSAVPSVRRSVHSIPLAQHSIISFTSQQASRPVSVVDEFSSEDDDDDDDDSSISREYRRKEDFDRFDVLKRKFNPSVSSGSSSQSSVFSSTSSSVSSSFEAASSVVAPTKKKKVPEQNVSSDDEAASSVVAPTKKKKAPKKNLLSDDNERASSSVAAPTKKKKAPTQNLSSDDDDIDDDASTTLSTSVAATNLSTSVLGATFPAKRKPTLSFIKKK